MLIRRFHQDDAVAVARLFHASVHEIGGRYYSPEQVAAWSPAAPAPDRIVARAQDGRTFLVALDDLSEVTGFIDLERDGHIDFLYCRPDVIGRGVGSALYDQIELIARDARISFLHTEASEAALDFFVRKGFAVERRRDFAHDGVAIHNYRMVKSLIG